MTKFDDTLADALKGSRVYVASADGREYEGWAEAIHSKYQHVILRDAENVALGRDAGRVFVRQVDAIEELESTSRIERVPLDAVDPAPYSVRDLDAAENRGYIAKIRDRGFAGSFPVVRPHPSGDDRYQIVEGHKRLWAAEKAGLDEHPVEIDDSVDDWTLALRFIADHLPDEAQVRDDGSTYDNCYGNEETEAAIERLHDEWGDRVLHVDEVAFNVERLGLLGDEDEPEPEAEADAEDDGDVDIGPDTPLEDAVEEWEGVGQLLAGHLYDAGYDTVGDIRDASVEDLADAKHVGPKTAETLLERATGEPVDTTDDDDDGGDVPCPECDRTFDSEYGRNIHVGQVHSDDKTSDTLSDDIDEELGLDDGAEETESDEGNDSGVEFAECETCGKTFKDSDARDNHETQMHGGDASEGVATDGSGAAAQQPPVDADAGAEADLESVDVEAPGASVEDSPEQRDETIEKYLPSDATRDDVRELADEHDYLVDIADALGIEKGEARVLLVRLGVYENNISEAAKYRGGVD